MHFLNVRFKTKKFVQGGKLNIIKKEILITGGYHLFYFDKVKDDLTCLIKT